MRGALIKVEHATAFGVPDYSKRVRKDLLV